jgi:hypothetical protein
MLYIAHVRLCRNISHVYWRFAPIMSQAPWNFENHRIALNTA